MDIFAQTGQQALMNILAYIIFIGMALYAIQGLRIEQLFKKGKTFQIQLFYVFLSIVIGSTVADFFLNFLNWSQLIVYIFQ